jgi:predicted dithiol-disulfide oxidoreductase (DUF899 family)
MLDLFEGRPQLIVYRFFFEPGVAGWPESGCRGCSLVAGDQLGHLAHLNARDTTLAFVWRAPSSATATGSSAPTSSTSQATVHNYVKP